MRLSSDEQNGSATLRFMASLSRVRWGKRPRRVRESGVAAAVGRHLCYLPRGRMMVS
jgi:hypothetical protein